VSWSNFGLRLQATAALLTGRYRLSRREAEELLQDLCGVEISLGSVSQIEQRVSEAIAEPVREAVEAVRQSSVVYVDETGWKEANDKANRLVRLYQAVYSDPAFGRVELPKKPDYEA